MLAGKYNITCEQGATFDLQLTWKGSDGSLVNVTGYTARMQVKKSRTDTTNVVSLTTENSRIVLGGAAGTIDLTIDATTTAALDVGQFVYDLELINGSTVYRVIEGAFTVSGEVTR